MINYYMNDAQYLQHHGVKGQRWGVRKASKSKQRGSKLVNKYGSKEQATAAVNKKAKIKQIAKKSALALMTVGASYVASQAISMADLNVANVRNGTRDYENKLRNIIDSDNILTFTKNKEAYFSPEKGIGGKSYESIYRHRNYYNIDSLNSSMLETSIASLTAGALGGATVATKSSSTSRRDRRKLKDINNA